MTCALSAGTRFGIESTFGRFRFVPTCHAITLGMRRFAEEPNQPISCSRYCIYPCTTYMYPTSRAKPRPQTHLLLAGEVKAGERPVQDRHRARQHALHGAGGQGLGHLHRRKSSHVSSVSGKKVEPTDAHVMVELLCFWFNYYEVQACSHQRWKLQARAVCRPGLSCREIPTLSEQHWALPTAAEKERPTWTSGREPMHVTYYGHKAPVGLP